MFTPSSLYPMETIALPGDSTKQEAVRKSRPLRQGLIVLRSLQMSLAFAAFVVIAAWLSSYIPIGNSLRKQQELSGWWKTYLDWLNASVVLAVHMMLLSIISLTVAIMGLWFTVRQEQRKDRRCLVWYITPDRKYTYDLSGDISTAVAWFVLLLAMAIIDNKYMAALGMSLSDIQLDALSMAVIVLPVLLLVVCIVSAVFSGLMRKQLVRQNPVVVPQHFITTYNI